MFFRLVWTWKMKTWLEDVEEMEGAELLTSGEEESDADDLYRDHGGCRHAW